PAAPRTVYAAMTSVGAFVSRDGAAHWQPLRGLGEPRVESLALGHGPPRTLYAATADGVFARSGSGWRRAGLRGRWLEAVAVHHSGIVYAGSLHDGVFTSRNGGRSWRQSNAGLGNLYVRTLLADPR